MIELNPVWLDRGRYVEFLNRSFGGHWDRRSHDWYLARDFNGTRSDLLIRTEQGCLVAGVSLSYRQVRAGCGPPIQVCIASAGATLPAARGRGIYAEIMRAAADLAHERGCAAMIGFATRDNPSARGLLRMGARAIPTFYLNSRPRGAVERMTRRWVDADPCVIMRRLAVAVAPGSPEQSVVRFHYARREDREWQFIRRAYPVAPLRRGSDCFALIESVGETDRLQFLDCPRSKQTTSIASLAALSSRAGRRFFFYTLDPSTAAMAGRIGFGIRHGFLLLLPTGNAAADFESLVNASWSVQSGDRL